MTICKSCKLCWHWCLANTIKTQPGRVTLLIKQAMPQLMLELCARACVCASMVLSLIDAMATKHLLAVVVLWYSVQEQVLFFLFFFYICHWID